MSWLPEDRIILTDLLARCVIGQNPEERHRRQDILIQVTLAVDLRPAGMSDDLADTVDYCALKKRLLAHAESCSPRLLERLAHDLSDICLEQPRVMQVTLRLEKPGALRLARSVAIEVCRRRKE